VGTRGPVGKRSEELRRRNKKPKPDKAGGADVDVAQIPEPLDTWHAIAKQWYLSLEPSGQSEFYEPSDWAMAYLIAESISRDLKPQVVGINEETGKPVKATIPLKGASLSAYLKAMTALLVSEGDRRRANIELQRGGGDEPAEKSAGVVALDAYRKQLEA
jgi:hypothetical protein